MLKLEIPIKEWFDDSTSRFVVGEAITLEFEHSLASLSKWESFFEKPFLGSDEKTREETLWYVQNAMLLTPNVSQDVLSRFSKENFDTINEYINAKQTATWFRETEHKRPSREIVTAEVIYHWMVSYKIWLECEHWHLNRLLTLIKVCNEKAAPPKKMNRREQIAERQKLNAQRKAQYGIGG